jgi:hypothetical protein
MQPDNSSRREREKLISLVSSFRYSFLMLDNKCNKSQIKCECSESVISLEQDSMHASLFSCSLVHPSRNMVLIAGQSIGSKAGTRLYTIGGYRASGALSCGWIGMNLLILLARGPHTTKWIGWQGGAELRKGKLEKEEPGTV